MQRTLVVGLLFALFMSSARVTNAATKDTAPTLYHVEVLLFAVNDPAAIASEYWPDTFGISETTKLVYITYPEPNAPLHATLSKEVPVNKPALPVFQFLGREEYKLTASFFKLKNTPQYEVLMHTAWRQPAIDFKDDSAVYVFDGMMEPAVPMDAAPTRVSTAFNNLAAEDFDMRVPRFSGTLKLARGQYLHVALDMLYRNIVGKTDSIDGSGNPIEERRSMTQGFHLKEIRRIKAGEVHYFDHPAFGALVLVAATEKIKGTDVEKETSPAAAMPND